MTSLRPRSTSPPTLILAVLALFPWGLQAQEAAADLHDEAERGRVVIYDLKAQEGNEALAAQLTEAVLTHVGKDPALIVIGQSELKTLLEHEKEKEVLSCEGQDVCLAKLSRAASAENVITGHVGRVGGTTIVNVKIADAAKGAVTRGETASSEDTSELEALVLAAIDRLLGREGAVEEATFEMSMAPEGTRAAVLDLAAHGVKPGLAESLTQLLSMELKRFEGLGVISRDEIQAMLRYESDKQVLQCSDDTSCLVEIGGALGVDYLVSGSVGALGEVFVLNLKLMDIHEAEVVHRVAEPFQGDEAHLPQALRFAAWRLLGRPIEGTGGLKVQANVEEGKLALDGGEAATFPLEVPLSEVVVGKHRVNLTADGFYPLYQEAYVEPARITELNLKLQALPRPWYKKWWPWTIIGGVVAAGAITTTVLLLDQPDSGSVHVTVE
jgi:TolB-like protein